MLTLWLQEKEILPNASLGYRVPHSDLAPSSQRDYCYMGKNIPNWLMLKKKKPFIKRTLGTKTPTQSVLPTNKATGDESERSLRSKGEQSESSCTSKLNKGFIHFPSTSKWVRMPDHSSGSDRFCLPSNLKSSVCCSASSLLSRE